MTNLQLIAGLCLVRRMATCCGLLSVVEEQLHQVIEELQRCRRQALAQHPRQGLQLASAASAHVRISHCYQKRRAYSCMPLKLSSRAASVTLLTSLWSTPDKHMTGQDTSLYRGGSQHGEAYRW